jgi:hypothetical protein
MSTYDKLMESLKDADPDHPMVFAYRREAFRSKHDGVPPAVLYDDDAIELELERSVAEHRGIRITRTHKSPSTGRKCQTPQGWVYVLFSGTRFASSLKKAKTDIENLWEYTQRDIDDFHHIRVNVLKWIERTWPEDSQVIRRKLELIRAEAAEREQARLEKERELRHEVAVREAGKDAAPTPWSYERSGDCVTIHDANGKHLFCVPVTPGLHWDGIARLVVDQNELSR